MFLITLAYMQLISQSQLRRELEFSVFMTGNGIKKGINMLRYHSVGAAWFKKNLTFSKTGVPWCLKWLQIPATKKTVKIKSSSTIFAYRMFI